MKTILRMLSVISVLLFSTAWSAPTLSKEQVIQLGHVVLAASENKDYKDIFWNAQPQYDEKKETWMFMAGFPVTPDGTAYIFEIREADGFYRLGWNNGQKSSQGFDQFRIQPSTRRELTELLKAFRKQ